MKIVVAMSGGVDSSAAAGLLVEAGHEVIGLAMKTHASEPKQNRACCTPDDMRDARRVADRLGIPFYVLNYVELFEEVVVRPFAEAYLNGRTPNPCIECNDKVKFKTLLKRARDLGAERLATGHYAQIGERNGQPALLRGADAKKDQSYFLYRLSAEQLATVLFPVGGMTKDEVRGHAERLGLPVAHKAESQEICFVGAEGYATTVEKLAGRGGQRGLIVDGTGTVLGEHAGVHHFTLGQRRGLGIAAPAPLYVTDVDAAAGTVQVGPKDALLIQDLELEGTTWSSQAPAPGTVVGVQQRYREAPKLARIEAVGEGTAQVRFLAPESRGAPGQAAVLYDGTAVLGGGRIVPSRRLPDAVAASPSPTRADQAGPDVA